MKLFKLYWNWYDDHSFWLFIHPNKTQSQFKKDVKSLLIKYGADYLASEDSWVGVSGWIEYIVPKMEELDYEQVKPISYGHFGSYILRDDEDTIKDKKWEKVVGKKLFDAALKKNKKLSKELYEKR